jgi:hypothetical protein
MTSITKTNQPLAVSPQQSQHAQFETAKTVTEARITLQPPNITKFKLVRPQAHQILKTNGNIRSLNGIPKSSPLPINTLKNLPLSPNASMNAVNAINGVKVGAAALGTGELATGTGAVGGFLTLGTLATLGLSLLAGGVTFFAGMGSANSQEPDVRKLEAARLKKQKAQQDFKPKFKQLVNPFGEPKKDDDSFITITKPKPFTPKTPQKAQPVHKQVPVVPSIPIIAPSPVGGLIKLPPVPGVKFHPLVKQDGTYHKEGRQNHKPFKEQPRASASTIQQTTAKAKQEPTVKKKTAVNPSANRNAHPQVYEYIFKKWCEDNRLDYEKVQSDPYYPEKDKPNRFFRNEADALKYRDKKGVIHDAEIFDNFATNATYEVEKFKSLPYELKLKYASNEAEKLANYNEELSSLNGQLEECRRKRKNIKSQIERTIQEIQDVFGQDEIPNMRKDSNVSREKSYLTQPIKNLDEAKPKIKAANKNLKIAQKEFSKLEEYLEALKGKILPRPTEQEKNQENKRRLRIYRAYIKATESPEENVARLKKQADAQAALKARKTPEQRQIDLEKDMLAARERRAEQQANETPDEKNRRLEKEAARGRDYLEYIRTHETLKQKEVRLKKAREVQQRIKAAETPKQKEQRLEKDKIKARERRARKRAEKEQ